VLEHQIMKTFGVWWYSSTHL